MPENVKEMFEKSGALLNGHFLLTSGLHSPVYWEKALVIQSPEYTEKLCKMIAGHYKKSGVQVVAGPTTPGIILSYVTARHLGVRGVFAEKDEATGARIFRRGFEIKPGEKVLIVDDVMTTGGSVSEVIAAVKKLQGDIVGVGVLVLLYSREPDFGVPFYACLKTDVITYQPDNCPLCKQGLPLVKRGSSKAK